LSVLNLFFFLGDSEIEGCSWSPTSAGMGDTGTCETFGASGCGFKEATFSTTTSMFCSSSLNSHYSKSSSFMSSASTNFWPPPMSKSGTPSIFYSKNFADVTYILIERKIKQKHSFNTFNSYFSTKVWIILWKQKNTVLTILSINRKLAKVKVGVSP